MLCLVTETLGRYQKSDRRLGNSIGNPCNLRRRTECAHSEKKQPLEKPGTFCFLVHAPTQNGTTHLLTSDGPHFSVIFESVPHSTTRVAES